MNINTLKSKLKIRRSELILISLLVIAGIVILSLATSRNTPKNTDVLSQTEQVESEEVNQRKKLLEESYLTISELEKIPSYTALYDYLTPTERETLSREEYIQKRRDARKNYYDEDFKLEGVEVRGDKGYVTRTYSFCKTPGCAESERIAITNKQLFFYINGKWYRNLEANIYCDREQPYSMSDEFDRSISLIIQRFRESNDTIANSHAKRFESIKNCLDIQYAQSEEEMSGTEGVFMFDELSNPEHLHIYVSPRYSVKDDLLTAILLSHEIGHAFMHATGSDKIISCYENEANAFTGQFRFIATLNEEELWSLSSRYNNNSSPEAVATLDLLRAMAKSSGSTPQEKALNYVKSSTFYQQQCGE